MTDTNDAIAILGGTGDQGLGLALRFCGAGRRVLIGSRKKERAVEAAENVRSQVPNADVEGFGNEDATAGAGIVILPCRSSTPRAPSRRSRNRCAKVRSWSRMAVPLATAIGDGAVRTVGIWQGSAAEMGEVAGAEGGRRRVGLPERLGASTPTSGRAVECDVVVSGAKAAREKVMALCPLVEGLRALDGGRSRTLGSSRT